ncbi:hypothetical protein FRC01_000399 [Tulasnella sp. 417]|nr:hypothetical protein FRC01_000399 [Tulasnella sp. 417]
MRLRMGHLWDFNVHSGPPLTFVRARAIIYPTQLVLSWIAHGGGRGVVTLALVNCTKVRGLVLSGILFLVQPPSPLSLLGLHPSPPISRSTPSTGSLRSEQTEPTTRNSSTQGSRFTTFLPPQPEILINLIRLLHRLCFRHVRSSIPNVFASPAPARNFPRTSHPKDLCLLDPPAAVLCRPPANLHSHLPAHAIFRDASLAECLVLCQTYDHAISKLSFYDTYDLTPSFVCYSIVHYACIRLIRNGPTWFAHQGLVRLLFSAFVSNQVGIVQPLQRVFHALQLCIFQLAAAQDSQAPTWSFNLRYAPFSFPPPNGHLWSLNVHSGSPFTYVRTLAILYPTQLVLSWIAPGGGRGVVTLDLVNCTEVRSVPSPAHHSAQNDIGSIAAREQSAAPGADNLIEILCPFQLLYGDGVERLAAESARERVRWVGAIWDALSRATTIAAQSTRASSPPLSLRLTPSIRSLRSEQTEQTSRTTSTEGSRSTTFLPPQSEIPTIRSPSISSESFTGSASSVSGPRFRTSTLASASIFGPRSETQSVVSARSVTDTQSFTSPRTIATESQSLFSPRSGTDSRSVVSSRSGTESQSAVSSRSGTETQSAVSASSRSTDFRSPATQPSAMSGTPVTQSTELRSSSSVTSDSLTEGRTPSRRTGTFRSPSAFTGPRSAMTFLSPTFTGTGTFTRSLDDSVLSSGADSFASEGLKLARSISVLASLLVDPSVLAPVRQSVEVLRWSSVLHLRLVELDPGAPGDLDQILHQAMKAPPKARRPATSPELLL